MFCVKKIYRHYLQLRLRLFLSFFFSIVCRKSADKLSLAPKCRRLSKGALALQSQEGAVGAQTARTAHLRIAFLIDTAPF